MNEIPTKPQVNKTAPKSFSIKNAVNGITSASKTENSEIIAEPISDEYGSNNIADVEVPIISEENLFNSWRLFATQIKDDKPNHSSILQSYQPHLIDDYKIGIVLESQLQVDLFLEIKSDLLFYIRNQLKNKQLDIVETIEEQQTQSRLYTTEDKFKFMLQKNPNLAKLKQQLNLDFS